MTENSRGSMRVRIRELVKIGVLLISLACVHAFAGNAWTEQGTTSTNPRDTRAAAKQVKQKNGELFALVVGISKYMDRKEPHRKIRDLTRAAIDAQDFAEFLKQQEDAFEKLHVTLLVNEQATRAAVETELKYKLRKAGKDDTIIIFLSGHGAPDPFNPEDFYFVTYDADPEYLGATAVQMSGLAFTRSYESQRVLLIADACHAGGFSLQPRTKSLDIGPALTRFAREIRESSGTATIMSSKPGQTSLEQEGLRNSVFTHFLLEGLRGKADKDGDSIVSLEEAYQYAYRRTHRATDGNQSPQKDAGSLVGLFPLSYVGPRLSRTELQRHLLHAAEAGNAGKVMELLEDGVPVDSRNRQNDTPLLLALRKGHKKVVHLLLQRRASVNARNNEGYTALIYAAEQGDSEVVESLLEHGAEIDAEDARGEKALTRAARNGHLGTVRLLLERGANIRARTGTGNTALSLAAQNAHLEIVRLLLQKGAPVDGYDHKKRTALTLAARNGHPDVVKLLLASGADPLTSTGESADKRASSAEHDFFKAVLLGDAPKVTELLEKDPALARARTNGGDTALLLASCLGHAAVVEKLLQKGAEVDFTNKYHATPLMWASYNGKPDVVEKLLAHGTKVNALDKMGAAAVVYAADAGHQKIVEILAAKGADLQARGQQGTALALAAKNGHPGVVQFLLDKGVEVDSTGELGATALILAATNGHSKIVNLLLAKGAKVNTKSDDGSTALIRAAGNGHLGVVQVLVAAGADVNLKNDRALTALILAAKNGHAGVVNLLLARGAQTDPVDWEGITAFRHAVIAGHDKIAERLGDDKSDHSQTR